MGNAYRTFARGWLVAAVVAGVSGCGPSIATEDSGRDDAGTDSAVDGFVAVSVQDDTNCALHASGAAVCWGYSFVTPLVVNEAVVQVSAGWNQACVLIGDEIRCEPAPFDTRSRHPDVPPAAYTQVASGLNISCGLKTSGHVDCWGWDDDASPELAAPTMESMILLRVNTRWACAVTETLQGHCWHPAPQGSSIEPLPEGSYQDVATDANGAHCGIDLDGEIRCGVGVCPPDPTTPGEHLPCEDYRGWDTVRDEPIRWRERVGTGPGGPFAKLSMSTSLFMCALRPSGVLDCWGEAYEPLRASEPDALFRDFDVGTSHVCGVTIDGDIRCWGWISPGSDDWGQLAPPPWP